MIGIHIVRDNQGFIWEFTIKGHARYSRDGEDIVCAAVSAIAYTAVGSLDELAGIKNYTEKDGFMKCNIPLGISQEQRSVVKIILDSMVIGFKQIEDAYGKYVSVIDEEV